MLKAKPKLDKAELAELSVAQLRDELLACDPVNTDWVIQINRVSLSVHALCLKQSSKHMGLCVLYGKQHTLYIPFFEKDESTPLGMVASTSVSFEIA